MDFYKPKEDTFFLLEELKKFLQKKENEKLNIFEVGLGSGFISLELKKKFSKNNFFGSDINEKAIQNTKKIFKENNLKINCKTCNFFDKFENKKFDLIFFNTPYLPVEKNEKFKDLSTLDKAIYGGKKGYEITINFLEKLKNFLEKQGVCFFLISSLTNQKIIEKKLKELNFNFKIQNKKNLFFEKLLIYKINF